MMYLLWLLMKLFKNNLHLKIYTSCQKLHITYLQQKTKHLSNFWVRIITFYNHCSRNIKKVKFNKILIPFFIPQYAVKFLYKNFFLLRIGLIFYCRILLQTFTIKTIYEIHKLRWLKMRLKMPKPKCAWITICRIRFVIK